MANQMPAPPYTPGFGRRPPVVAGRDALLDDVERVLEVGPEHPRFCRAILGSRGTGKTVLLDVIGEVASKELGWAVLHVQALQEESLVGVLLQRLPETIRPWERFGRGSKDLQAQLNVGANLGAASARATVERGHTAGTGNAAAAFEDALGRVGSFAAGHGTGLLVTVDEAQMVPQEDLSALARALQTVVARRLQPVAVVFGGLETFRERLAGAGAYASRLPVEQLANLEPSARAWPWSSPRPAATWPGKTKPSASWCAARAAIPTTCSCSAGTPGRRPRGRPRSPWPTPKPGLNRHEPSWRASTKPPGAACGPRSATTWPPWPAWPARAAPG